MNYYVYTHIFANGVRYIGKGKNYRHINTKNRNRYWTSLYNKYGKPTIEITIRNLTNKESLDYEKQCIANYKLCNIPLCNLTDGGEGEGHPHTEEHKQLLKLSNPNAKTVHIYNHNDELQATYKGTLTKSTEDLPKNAFIKSYKNQGMPLGLTKQSRIELRKRMHQHFIGWYALLDGDQKADFPSIPNLYKEQTTGLSSKLPTDQSGSGNPNAKAIIVLDNQQNIVFTSKGDFAKKCKQYNIPKSLAEKAKRTGTPINTSRINLQHLNGYTVKYQENT